MRYAVTGATGFVGRALVKRLLADGHAVTAVVRDPAKAADLVLAGAAASRADLADRAALARAFADHDGVFHVAGWYRIGAKDSDEAWRVNVAGTRNVLSAAEEAAVPRVVFTSTCAVNSDTRGETVDETHHFEGKHLTVYDATKARAHEETKRFAATHAVPEVIIVMPGGIYGPGDTSSIGHMMTKIAAGKRVPAPASIRIMEAHVDDVAVGHLLAMQLGKVGQAYMLAGERTDLMSFLTEWAQITGGPHPVPLPAPMLRASQRTLGKVGKFLPLRGDYSAEALRISTASYLGTPAKAQRELGWTFRSLHEGLRDTAEALGLA